MPMDDKLIALIKREIAYLEDKRIRLEFQYKQEDRQVMAVKEEIAGWKALLK